MIGAVRTCRVCGCTEQHACYNPKDGACSWAEQDLCSHCVPAAALNTLREAMVSDDLIRVAWKACSTGATNIAIDEQNRTNDDDGPSEVIAAQGEIIRRLKQWMTPTKDEIDLIRSMVGLPNSTFQARVAPWMQECFSAEVSADKLERGDRLLEEVFELLQSGDYPRERIRALETYVYERPKGEPAQEVGGVMITLAAYCLPHGLDMHAAGEAELKRISQPEMVLKIRAKQASKPTGSALPIAAEAWYAVTDSDWRWDTKDPPAGDGAPLLTLAASPEAAAREAIETWKDEGDSFHVKVARLEMCGFQGADKLEDGSIAFDPFQAGAQS